MVLEKSVCKLTKCMSKFHISTQFFQGNALFSGKNYTTGNNFTRLPVATVATNFRFATNDPRSRKLRSKVRKRQQMVKMKCFVKN